MRELAGHRGLKGDPTSEVVVHVLGCFSVSVNGSTVDLAPTAQRVLALLALDDRPRERELVAGTLWPDSSQTEAAASLRTALWRIRRRESHLIICDNRAIRLSPGTTVDLQMMATGVRELVNGEWSDTTGVDELLKLDLLPGWYDDWVIAERERARQLRLHGLEALARHQAAREKFTDALETALTAVRCDELRESAHRVVIEIHVAEGNLSEAVRHYANFAARLKAELNLDPSPRMVQLIESLMRRSHVPAMVTLP